MRLRFAEGCTSSDLADAGRVKVVVCDSNGVEQFEVVVFRRKSGELGLGDVTTVRGSGEFRLRTPSKLPMGFSPGVFIDRFVDLMQGGDDVGP